VAAPDAWLLPYGPSQIPSHNAYFSTILMVRLRRSTREITCPDGTPRTVHRDIDDAFPLFLPEYQAKVATSVQELAGNGIQLNGAVERGIAGVLLELSDINDTIMPMFRAVYATYMASPCENADFLARKVDELTVELQRLTAARLELRALVELAAANPGNSDLVWETFSGIVSRYNVRSAPQAGTFRIKKARQTVARWIEGP
jgi:hypothetical protein